MAITRTATYTATYTRTVLIKMQIERVLMRSGMNPRNMRSVLHGVDQRWISEISVYGLDGQGYCHTELFVRIDWNRNALHLAAGRDTVQIDAGWEDGISTEIDLALQKFETFCRDLRLTKKVTVRYAPGLDSHDINRRLGFSPAAPVQWRGGTIGTVMSIPELDEVTVGLNAADG